MVVVGFHAGEVRGDCSLEPIPVLSPESGTLGTFFSSVDCSAQILQERSRLGTLLVPCSFLPRRAVIVAAAGARPPLAARILLSLLSYSVLGRSALRDQYIPS
jgi:hypothetical protein